MELKKLMVDTKSMWIDFTGIDGFSVEVVNLSRKELTALRKKCTTTKFNRRTRQPEENLDEDRFITEFSAATIKNWKGLTLEKLQDLLLIDIGDQDPQAELEYSQDNAETLVNNSTEFDTWLNEVVFDLDNFRSQPERTSAPKVRKPTEKQ